jgi:hypothetical protein
VLEDGGHVNHIHPLLRITRRVILREEGSDCFLLHLLIFVILFLGQQVGAQNIAQHLKVEWLIQNFCGPGIKGTVGTLLDIAGGRPSGIYHYRNVLGQPIPL